VIETIVKRCDVFDSGARLANALLAQELLPEIGDTILKMQKREDVVRRLDISVDGWRLRCESS
jgi:ATP-dependent Clp protease ATP-binding subunit ClpA